MTTLEETEDLEKSVDSESFIEADIKSTQSQETKGVAVMKKLHYAKDYTEIPKEYKRLIYPRDNTEFYILECEDVRSNEEIVLVARQGNYHNELDMIKEWTGVDSVSHLAGKRVPFESTEYSSIYKFPEFRFNFIDSDIDSVKQAYELGWIEYRDGQWVKSEKVKKYERYINTRTTQIRSAFWIVMVLGFLAPSTWIGFPLLLTAVSLFLSNLYLESRNKPIEFIADNI